MLFVKDFARLPTFANYLQTIYYMEKEELLVKAEQAFEAEFGVPSTVENFNIKTIVDGGVLFTPSIKERDAYLERERLVRRSILGFSILLVVMFIGTIGLLTYQYRVLGGLRDAYMYTWIGIVIVAAIIAAAIDSKRYLTCERLECIYTGEGKNMLYNGEKFICLQKSFYPCI